MLHRDELNWPYATRTEEITVTAIFALTDFTEANGATRVVPGSHKIGILHPGHYTSDEDIAKHVDEDNIVDLTAEAGEAILIHNWLRIQAHEQQRKRNDPQESSVTYYEYGVIS